MSKGIYLLISSFVVSLLNIPFSINLLIKDLCILNSGIAFGIRIEYGILITIVLLLFLIIFGIYIKNIFRYYVFSIAILGISNLFIRVMYGGVCDYINLSFIHVNIVDMGIVSICVWSVMLIIWGKYFKE